LYYGPVLQPAPGLASEAALVPAPSPILARAPSPALPHLQSSDSGLLNQVRQASCEE